MSSPTKRFHALKLAYITTLPGTQFRFLAGQNQFMSARGIELHAISSPGPSLERLRARDGVEVHSLPIARSIRPLRDLWSLIQIYRLLRRIRPTIVHLSTPKAAFLGAIAARAAGVPSRLYYVRGLATETQRGARRFLFRNLEALTHRLCTVTICVAPSLLEFGRKEGIIGRRGGIVVGEGMSNGIDVDRFSPERTFDEDVPMVEPRLSKLRADGAGSMCIGFVGRLAKDKGIEDLAAAWEALRDNHPKAYLLLVGPWESENPVSAVVRARLGEDSRVVTVGRVEDVAPYLSLMQIFAYPSHGTEGFPNAPMEAAAMGLPVVATRVVGCTDAVHDGRTGLLVPPQNPAALAEALKFYLADPQVARLHGREGRRRVVELFQRHTIWEGLYQEYLRMAHAGRRAEISQ